MTARIHARTADRRCSLSSIRRSSSRSRSARAGEGFTLLFGPRRGTEAERVLRTARVEATASPGCVGSLTRRISPCARTETSFASTYGPVLVMHALRPIAAPPRIEFGSASVTRTRQPEPIQQRVQRRSLQTEPCGGSPRASDHPVGLFENSRDVGSLNALQRLGFLEVRLRPGCDEVRLRPGLDRNRRQRQAGIGREDYSALDHVFELADVTWPGVATECVEGLVGDQINVPIHATGELGNEGLTERPNVPGSPPGGADRDRKDVEAVVEIVTEPLRSNHPVKITVRRGDHAHIDPERPRPADTLELAFLQPPQPLWLQLEGNLADLIEKQRAAVRKLEPSDPLCDRARERSSLVAEHLALQQTS